MTENNDPRMWSVEEIEGHLLRLAKRCLDEDCCSMAPSELSYCGTQKAVEELRSRLAEWKLYKQAFAEVAHVADKLQALGVQVSRTDTERLDFVEAYLQREGFVDDALRVKVRVWTVATESTNPDGLRQTIDTMMDQREKLHHG